MIPVTQSLMPDRRILDDHIDEILGTSRYSNDGPKVRALEVALRVRFGSWFAATASGTSALTIALQALRCRGEVITTPFTFPATAHAIFAAGCRPVFCDVDPKTGCIDPLAARALVGPDTSAILAVHVYGRPCDHTTLDIVARECGLKLIYDAAHAFCLPDAGKMGDAVCFSFHATKLFHTCEGGAVATTDIEVAKRARLLRNFGIEDEVTVSAPGTNAKMSEVHAAVGLAVLPRVHEEVEARIRVGAVYSEMLGRVPGVTVPPNPVSHYPVLLPERARDLAYTALRDAGAHARRYFYPLASEAPFLREDADQTPRARSLSRRVLCLPFFGALPISDAERIARVVVDTVRRHA